MASISESDKWVIQCIVDTNPFRCFSKPKLISPAAENSNCRQQRNTQPILVENNSLFFISNVCEQWKANSYGILFLFKLILLKLKFTSHKRRKILERCIRIWIWCDDFHDAVNQIKIEFYTYPEIIVPFCETRETGSNQLNLLTVWNAINYLNSKWTLLHNACVCRKRVSLSRVIDSDWILLTRTHYWELYFVWWMIKNRNKDKKKYNRGLFLFSFCAT